MTLRDRIWFIRKCLSEGVDEQSEWIRLEKRELRKMLEEPKNEWPYGERRIIKSDDEYPSYIERIELPDDFSDIEEAREWANEVIRIPYRWREYSPTGQWFTSGISVFNVCGKYLCYHLVDMDV